MRSSRKIPLSRAIQSGAKSITILGMAMRIFFCCSAAWAIPTSNKQTQRETAPIAAAQAVTNRLFVIVLAPLFSRDDDSVALVRSLDKRSRHGLLEPDRNTEPYALSLRLEKSA